MNSHLIVHHPYRTLSELQGPLTLSSDEIALAWSIINDHYLTDLPLLHPPHVIAVMAILISVVFKPTPGNTPIAGASAVSGSLRDGAGAAFSALDDKSGSGLPPRIQKIVDWLAAGEVDIEAVVECTQELISLYEVWAQYSEKMCREQIGRFVKSRGLDK